jgi:hypothetical protein
VTESVTAQRAVFIWRKEIMKPVVKMQAVGAGGAGALVVLWLAGLAGIDMPPEIAAAIALLAGWGAGYLKRDPVIEDGRLFQSMKAPGDPATE